MARGRPNPTASALGGSRGWVRWLHLLGLALAFAFAPAQGHDEAALGAAGLAARDYYRELASYDPPDVTLVDRHGQSVSIGAALSAEPRPIFLQFMFTTCAGVCPLLSSLLAQLQDELGPERSRVAMWSITIDPEADTQEQLQLYAMALGAERQWRFFTGSHDNIALLQRAFDAYSDNKMRHRPLTFLRARRDGTWLRLEGLLSAADLAAEYRGLVHP